MTNDNILPPIPETDVEVLALMQRVTAAVAAEEKESPLSMLVVELCGIIVAQRMVLNEISSNTSTASANGKLLDAFVNGFDEAREGGCD